jgi:hypothetical protein
MGEIIAGNGGGMNCYDEEYVKNCIWISSLISITNSLKNNGYKVIIKASIWLTQITF